VLRSDRPSISAACAREKLARCWQSAQRSPIDRRVSLAVQQSSSRAIGPKSATYVAVKCMTPVAPPEGGGGGSFPPYGWTSKNYIICVCFHCHGTSSCHKTNTKPYKFPLHCSKCVSFWGTSYSRPPIDPYLTPPLLQNPGGANA